MPFHVEHELFQQAEALTRKAEHTAKRNSAAKRRNLIAAAEAHEKARDAYAQQKGSEWAGGSYLREKSTADVAKVYVEIHALRATQLRQEAASYT